MANTLTESLSRSIQPQQSILPLRRERTITNRSLNRNSKPIYSEELPKRSSTFSAGSHRFSLLLLFSLKLKS